MWYRLDAADRIVALGGGWHDFAAENCVPELDRLAVLGKPIWHFFAGRAARHYYDEIFQTVRHSGREMKISFRCDAPDTERDMELLVAPEASAELTLTTTAFASRRTPRYRLWDNGQPRGGGLVTACSWCKRIKTANGRWLQLPEAIKQMALLNHCNPPEVSHGICTGCEMQLKAELNAELLAG